MTEAQEPQDVAGKVEVTAQQTINKLREAVQPKGKKGLWLRHLSDRRLSEVYHRLRMGQSSHHIAKMAKMEWGVMKDSDIKSLSRGVRQFRDKVVGDLKAEGYKTPERKEVAESVRRRGKYLTEKLDGLSRLRWLIDTQTERVALLVEKEKTSLPFRFTGKEVKYLGELLEMYVRFQIDLGLLDAKPAEFNLTVKHRFDGLLQNSLRGGGVSMIEATNKFLEMAEEKALTFKLTDDGAYAMEGIQDVQPESSED